MTVHSSLIPRGQPLSKLGPRGSRADEKAARLGEERRQLLEAHKAVDARDDGRCRVCGRRCSPKALALVDRAERHHMLRRRYEGAHVSANLVTLCQSCHQQIHSEGVLCVSGNADLRDDKGRLCGVKVERIERETWRIVGMV